MKRWIVSPWVFVGSILLLVDVEPACAIDNLRVAYPSMNTSVFCSGRSRKRKATSKKKASTSSCSAFAAKSQFEPHWPEKLISSPMPEARWRRRSGAFPSNSLRFSRTSPGWDLIAVVGDQIGRTSYAAKTSGSCRPKDRSPSWRARFCAKTDRSIEGCEPRRDGRRRSALSGAADQDDFKRRYSTRR